MTFLLNTQTGEVDLEENWTENDLSGLVKVVPNVPGDPDYDINFTGWRPAKE